MRNLSEAKNIALMVELMLQEKGTFDSNCRKSNSGSYSGDYQKSVNKGKVAQYIQLCVDKSKGKRSSGKFKPIDDREVQRIPKPYAKPKPFHGKWLRCLEFRYKSNDCPRQQLVNLVKKEADERENVVYEPNDDGDEYDEEKEE